MKRSQLTVIFLSALIFSVLLIQNTAFADTKSTDYEETAKALYSFGIIDSVTEIEYDKPIKRIDFAYWAANLLNYKGQQVEGYIFSDIEAEHHYYKSVSLLSQLGAISYKENIAFNPEDNISFDEAVKIIVSVLGYKDIADVNGGYPGGYLKIANKEKLLAGIDLSSVFDVKAALRLILNACDVEIMKSVKNGDAINYYTDEGDTLLSSYFGIYKTEDRINKTYYTSVVDDTTAPSGTVVIGNKTLKVKDNIEEYVGCEAVCYYRIEKGEQFGSVVYFTLADDDIIEISVDDFVSYSDGKIKYYDGGKKRTATLENDFIIIKNSKIVSENIAYAFDFDDGTITLVSDKSGNYSTVILRAYETWIVKNTDLRTQTIYDELHEIRELCVEKSNSFKITDVYTGDEYPLSYIAPGDVLTILRSDDNEYVNVYINEKSVAGEVQSVSKEKNGDRFLEIGGIEYALNREVKDFLSIKAGDEFTFKFDKNGRIANILTVNSDGYTAGWIYELKKGEGLSQTVAFKVFNQNSEHLTLECEKKVILDGTSVNSETLYNSLIKNGRVNRQLLRYKLNSEGIVTHIDTILYNSSKESVNSITEQVAYDGTGATFSRNGQTFYPRPVFSRDTIVFVVPDEDVDDYNEAMFLITKTGYFTTDIRYHISSYKIDHETPYADIIVVRGEAATITTTTQPMLVSSVTVGNNINENQSYIITGLRGNQLIKAACVDGLDASYIEEGDVIRIAQDIAGEIREIEMMYDYSEGTEPSWAPQINNFGNEYSVIFGYVYDKYLNYGYESDKLGNKPPDVLYISFNNDGKVDMEYPLPVNLNVMVYDNSLRENRVYFGTVNDITGSKYSSKGSKILLHTKWGSRLGLVVYK